MPELPQERAGLMTEGRGAREQRGGIVPVLLPLEAQPQPPAKCPDRQAGGRRGCSAPRSSLTEVGAEPGTPGCSLRQANGTAGQVARHRDAHQLGQSSRDVPLPS